MPTSGVRQEAAALIAVLQAENARLRGEGVMLRRLSALAVNRLCGSPIFAPEVDWERMRNSAVKEGLFVFDDLHHAPACPANHWHKQQLPYAPCSCGALSQARKKA